MVTGEPGDYWNPTETDLRQLEEADSSLMLEDGKEWEWRYVFRRNLQPDWLGFTEVRW